MEKSELLTIIGEKYNEISRIEDEIKELQVNYAKEHTQLKADDKVLSSSFKNDNIILRCTGEVDYTFNSDHIFVECEIVTSDTERFKPGTVLSIPEKYLTKI
jgi:hypothetical protein